MDRRQAKSLGPGEGSESAGDFHFDPGHPDVLFGQVVGERDVEVDEEAEHVVLEGFEPGQEIEAGPMLEAPARLGPALQVGKARWKARPSRTACQY